MDSIIEQNVALMKSSNKGGMGWLAQQESLAGNAKTWAGYMCVGVYFYCDQAGKIEVFDLPQHVSPTIQKTCRVGVLRVAQLPHDDPRVHEGKSYCIVEIQFDTESAAYKTVYQSVKTFNDRFGFSPQRNHG